MGSGQRVALFELDDRLLTDVDPVSTRLMVITPAGPRHMDLSSLRSDIREDMISKEEFNRSLSWRMNIQAEQSFTHAVAMLRDGGSLYDSAPAFVLEPPHKPAPAPQEPERLVDGADYHELQEPMLGLQYVLDLPVQMGYADWRGRYVRPAPTWPNPPAQPRGEVTATELRDYIADLEKWNNRHLPDFSRYDRWHQYADGRFNRNDGSKANDGVRLVVLREAILNTATLHGCELDLPEASAGDEVLIPALVLAVQELNAYLKSDTFIGRVADQVAMKLGGGGK